MSCLTESASLNSDFRPSNCCISGPCMIQIFMQLVQSSHTRFCSKWVSSVLVSGLPS